MSFGSSRFGLKTVLADYWFLELSSYIARISFTEISTALSVAPHGFVSAQKDLA